LPNSSNNLPEEKPDNTKLFPSLSVNLEYLNSKFNLLINSDINIRKFTLTVKNKEYSSAIIYIDGMVDNSSINSAILSPILLKNSITMKPQVHSSAISKDISVKKIKKFNLEDFLYNNLIPQNNIEKTTDFKTVVEKINSGFCILLVDTLNIAFCIESKDIPGRSVETAKNEAVIQGPQEAFIENIRTNTGLIRKIVNNENLVIENTNVGKITNTQVCICYLSNVANNDLVAEVKYRINNLEIDSLTSSGELHQLIKDNPNTHLPQLLSTERPDKACKAILNGKVVVLVNGSPYSLIMPATLVDFLESPEDTNLNSKFSNFSRLIRAIALFFAIFLPGLYVAITNFHQELIPTELLFAISSSRESIPFPVIFELLIMEVSFELIREAGLRISSPFSNTIGIIGALILGEAAVNANIVSPILIIIVAFTGICGFAIPDFLLGYSVRVFRFLYIILGYLAGFLGIAVGFFIHFVYLSSIKSFGVPFFAPYSNLNELTKNSSYTLKSIWKREKRDTILNTKRPEKEEHISMKWKQI
jgi:spore germination protein KA